MFTTTRRIVAENAVKDPRTNVICDFEGDDDDAEEYGQWRRSLHPVDDFPLYVEEDDVYDEDSAHFRGRGCSMKWDAEADENDIEEYERSLGFNYDNQDWVDYIDGNHMYRSRQYRWAYSFRG